MRGREKKMGFASLQAAGGSAVMTGYGDPY